MRGSETEDYSNVKVTVDNVEMHYEDYIEMVRQENERELDAVSGGRFMRQLITGTYALGPIWNIILMLLFLGALTIIGMGFIWIMWEITQLLGGLH